MAQVNRKTPRAKIKTYEGGTASKINAEETLKRSVMAMMLWEDTFYEDGQSIVDRVKALANSLPAEKVIEIMLEAKFGQNIRHAPLLLVLTLVERRAIDRVNLAKVLDRVDLLPEFLAMYWADGRKLITHAMHKAFGIAFKRFDEYQLAKYNRDKDVKLRDILRIARPKPDSEEQAALWKKVLDGTLTPPDTWERELSMGKDKRATFTRLLKGEDSDDDEVTSGKHIMGDLAFLRNLRNMREAGVEEALIIESMRSRRWKWILPFQFIAAARYNPELEAPLETAMLARLTEEAQEDPMDLSVDILVDVSGSMNAKLSAKSELIRLDGAKGLAIYLREVFKNVHIYAFESNVVSVPARRGFALADAIGPTRGGTELWGAIRTVGSRGKRNLMIVITDEQTSDNGVRADANTDLLVIINVGTYQNGVAYGKKSLHINGWSDNIVKYLKEYVRKEMFRKVDTTAK